MNKYVIGAGVGAGILLIVLFKLLMASYEQQGKLVGEIEEAKAVIVRHEVTVAALQDARDEERAAREAEAKRADEAVRKLAESETTLEVQKREFEIELADIRLHLTPEERVCTEQPVPDAYFVRVSPVGDSP